jgi:phage gp46-like protein
MANLDITMGSRSAKTGRFNFVRGADGDVSFDETNAHAVVTSATERRASWWADAEHGSKLRELRNIRSATPSQAEAATLQSLAGLEANNEIEGVEVKATSERSAGQPTGRLSVDIKWTTPSGESGSATVR